MSSETLDLHLHSHSSGILEILLSETSKHWEEKALLSNQPGLWEEHLQKTPSRLEVLHPRESPEPVVWPIELQDQSFRISSLNISKRLDVT